MRVSRPTPLAQRAASLRDAAPLALRAGSSRGFTLLEVLLVLAVIAAVAGMAMPGILRSMTDHHLRSAAERLSAEVSATRSRAIDTGLMYQFLYEPGGRRFASIPYERETNPADNRRIQITSSATIDDLPRWSGQLPEGLVFLKEELIDFDSQSIASELFAGMADADSLASLRWSDPVLFHTDGSAEGPDIPISDPRKQITISLTVRDLTGAVTVGEVAQGGVP